MAILTTQAYGEQGAGLTFGAINESLGDQVRVDGKTQLVFKTSTATARTVTIARIACNQGFLHPLVITIAGNSTVYTPILDPKEFGSLANITYSAGAQADLTVAASNPTVTAGIV